MWWRRTSDHIEWFATINKPVACICFRYIRTDPRIHDQTSMKSREFTIHAVDCFGIEFQVSNFRPFPWLLQFPPCMHVWKSNINWAVQFHVFLVWKLVVDHGNQIFFSKLWTHRYKVNTLSTTVNPSEQIRYTDASMRSWTKMPKSINPEITYTRRTRARRHTAAGRLSYDRGRWGFSACCMLYVRRAGSLPIRPSVTLQAPPTVPRLTVRRFAHM